MYFCVALQGPPAELAEYYHTRLSLFALDYAECRVQHLSRVAKYNKLDAGTKTLLQPFSVSYYKPHKNAVTVQNPKSRVRP